MRALRLLVVLALLGCGDAPTRPDAGSDPATAEIVTSDLTNFWAAYDQGGSTGNASVFQREYLDRASPGLKDFIVRRNVTAQSLATMVTTYRNYFAAIRARNLQLVGNGAVVDRARAGFR